MIKLRNLTQRYPIVFAVVLMAAFELIPRFVNYILGFLPDGYGSLAIAHFAHILWPLALTFLLGYGFVLKEKGFGKTFKAGLGLIGVYLAIAVFGVFYTLSNPDVQWRPWYGILIGIMALLGIGLREDLLYRGVLQSALAIKYADSSKGIWLTVAVSSIAFGLLHFLNMFTGTTFEAAFYQVLGAAALGAAFGAIYLRGGNIWVPILIHALVDFTGIFNAMFIVGGGSTTDKINSLSAEGLLWNVPVPLLVAIFLLRKSKHAEILERMKDLRAKYGIKA